MSGNILFETSKWRDIVVLGVCMAIYDVCNDRQFENCTPLDFANFLNLREEAKDDEKRKEETAQAMKIAYALEYFIKKSPDILKNMSDVVSQLDPHKFASVLRAELKNASDELTREFRSKIEPMIKRAESTDRRISIPNLAAYLFLDTFIWLIIFLVMVIYATIKNSTGDLTSLIVLFFVCWIISVIGVVYFSRKYRW